MSRPNETFSDWMQRRAAAWMRQIRVAAANIAAEGLVYHITRIEGGEIVCIPCLFCFSSRAATAPWLDGTYVVCCPQCMASGPAHPTRELALRNWLKVDGYTIEGE